VSQEAPIKRIDHMDFSSMEKGEGKRKTLKEIIRS